MSEPEPDEKALLAHDIRAAVADVIGGLRLMDTDHLPAAEREQMGRVQAASELLARLVEELLIDDVPAEGLEPGGGNLNLRRFLEDELKRWRGVARPAGTVVRLDLHPDLPEVVRLNGLHLRRVVSNLMGNALRYGGGEVTLAAKFGEANALIFCVSDDGPGFPPDLLDRLFQPSTKGQSSPGTGMGLHIASAHAEGLGGHLTAENLPGRGARVMLIVPERVWRPEKPPGQNGLPDLTGRRVLVADDSPTNQLLVRSILAQLGAECEVASDGVEALNWLSRERFDAALIDVEMPVLGGLDVIRQERLRQVRGLAPPMAILAMTAYVARDNRAALREAGADDILAKPLPEIEVFGRLLQQHLDDVPDPNCWRPDMAPVLNLAVLTELLQSVGPEGSGALLDRIRADLAQVEARLTAALAGGDLPSVRAETHILLSLAGAVAALPTQDSAQRLNRLAQEGNMEAVSIAGKVCLGRLGALRHELAAAR
ncbi:MAG: ATP-binding protein [Pseudomonadota bacterium]